MRLAYAALREVAGRVRVRARVRVRVRVRVRPHQL